MTKWVHLSKEQVAMEVESLRKVAEGYQTQHERRILLDALTALRYDITEGWKTTKYYKLKDVAALRKKIKQNKVEWI